MGSRVHYILLDGDRRTLYTRGGGSGYDFDIHFAVGPEVVSRWLEALGGDELPPETDAGEDVWLGDLSCEGAILIDADRRELLLYWKHAGTHYREAMLDGYSRTWPGWRIEWAFDGLADLLIRLGLDPGVVRHEAWTTGTLRDGDLEVGECFAVSRSSGGRTAVHGLGGRSGEPWWHGSSLLNHLPASRFERAWSKVPYGGMHLDDASRTATVWSARPLKGLRDEWGRLWPGWRLDFRGADIGAQVALCQGAFEPPRMDLRKELAELAERVHEWPIESEVAERAVSMDYVREIFWHHFDAGLTPAERDHAVALILGSA